MEKRFYQNLVNIVIFMKIVPNLNQFYFGYGIQLLLFRNRLIFLIIFFKVNVNNIDRIDIVVRGDHGQGVFYFPMKLIHIMDDEESIEREVYTGYVYCRKDNGVILKNIIIIKLGE